ncbi:hypothetical protein HN789_04595 [archaeon]|jgi:hypothetical protein|nr:hypothetical protein [archaeon]MBT4022451.1 hypothetical protein [archaeon]MBT4272606.1 hypothetical protein [archaeon]MBT4461228.1 hypothetical protein [archaeon]MBT4858258.1 hypothetical protein [archaeon]
MNKKQKSKVFKFRKIRLSKKSQAYNILEYYLVRIPFILVLVALFVYMASSIESNALKSHDVRKEIIQNRIFYSPNSITYFDEDSGRIYPHIIDMERFNEIQLDQAFFTKENKVLTGKIDLTNIDLNITNTSYINRDQYERWKHYTKFSQFDNFIEKKVVLILHEGIIYRGAIKLNFVIPNE